MDTTITSNNQLDKELKKIEIDPKSTLAKQCDAEWNLAYLHQEPKKTEWLKRLKLFNNQRRDKQAVGDTTMFSIFQTVLASLYIDKLGVTWLGREEGDEDVAENLMGLSEYDYTEMEKDMTDYDWDWDTCFFGRGLTDLSEYIRDPDNNIYLPIPRVIDPTLFLRDPRATSINGNRMRRNSARFFGEETKMTREDIENNPFAEKTNIDFRSIKYGSGTRSLLENTSAARDDAQGNTFDRNKDEKFLRVNAEYDITVWNTHWKVNGKVEKVKVWLANERKLVVGFKVLKTDKWKIIDRPLYPTAHDWDGTSIPDLTEDKQRARAIAQNLGLKTMEADLYPSYIYNTNKITNKKDLNFNFNKFIPANVPEGQTVLDAIAPIRKSQPNMALLDFIYQSLDMSAQKATASSDIQQGIQPKKNRTLGETNLVVSNADTRYSLSAKIFGWSERKFWLEWYNCYKENFADNIDEKTIRIEGAFGPTWRKLTKDQITTKKIDPDVKVESAFESRAAQLEERQSMTNYFTMVLQDPTANRRYAFKELGKVFGFKKDRVDRLFPPTIDERIARDENLELNINKYVAVQATDDHEQHLEQHATAAATAATYAHVKTHEKALSMKKTNPELFPAPAPQVDTNGNPVPPQGQTGAPSATPANSLAPKQTPIAPSATSGQTTPGYTGQ